MQSFHQEVRRSLHQHMMHIYQAYEQELGADKARQVIAEELSHVGALFGAVMTEPMDDDSTERFWRAREHHRELGSYATAYLHAYAEVERAREHRALIEKGEQE